MTNTAITNTPAASWMTGPINECLTCHRSLTVLAEDDVTVLVHGETKCCCGTLDSEQNHYSAFCTTCCPGRFHSSVWDGKAAAGGTYDVNVA